MQVTREPIEKWVTKNGRSFFELAFGTDRTIIYY